MNKIITYETLRSFAYSNDRICKHPIRGVVLSFTGLGQKEMFHEDSETDLRYAEEGIVRIIPYYNPWCWMNRQTVEFVDEILDVLFSYYNLPKNTPVFSTGGSMGGLCALIYTAKGKYTPKVCVANCPVCDLPYHFTERPDLPRTLYSAFLGEEGTLQEILERYSPLHLAQKGEMPKVEYHVFHCTEDQLVNKQIHGDAFVETMKKSHKITCYPVLGEGHCQLPPTTKEKFCSIPEEYLAESEKNR